MCHVNSFPECAIIPITEINFGCVAASFRSLVYL
jgi:hypothetical protein